MLDKKCVSCEHIFGGHMDLTHLYVSRLRCALWPGINYKNPFWRPIWKKNLCYFIFSLIHQYFYLTTMGFTCPN